MFNSRLRNSLEYNPFPVNIHPDYRADGYAAHTAGLELNKQCEEAKDSRKRVRSWAVL